VDHAPVFPELGVADDVIFDGQLAHGRVVVPGRVDMRAVMGGDRDVLHRQAHAVGQLLWTETGKGGCDLDRRVLVRAVRNPGLHGGREPENRSARS
jgi:hypothetical protein